MQGDMMDLGEIAQAALDDKRWKEMQGKWKMKEITKAAGKAAAEAAMKGLGIKPNRF